MTRSAHGLRKPVSSFGQTVPYRPSSQQTCSLWSFACQAPGHAARAADSDIDSGTLDTNVEAVYCSSSCSRREPAGRCSNYPPLAAQSAIQSYPVTRAAPKSGDSLRHMAGLGGLRHARPDSINTGWRNASFRGFADYMQTAEFEKALDQLIQVAQKRRTAIMCAEAVPWRCHRSLIGDALLVRGIRVEEIASLTRTRPHTLIPWARVRRNRLSYPAI